MRFGPTDKFWMVLDPTPISELADILFETSILGLALQNKGGLEIDRRPMIFTDPEEARAEAMSRLEGQRTP